MRVCVVGSGGREHALAEVLRRHHDVVVTPGNPGIPGSTSEPATAIDADLHVIGPEAPLVAGLADELREAYLRYLKDPEFLSELDRDLKHYVGRPSPVYHAERLSRHLGGAQIFLKREDLNHTGAHKVNNTVGQALLAKRMGKTRIIAETGAGQHGVATATVAARLGLECVVYMGEVDVARQAPNVLRMKLLGATVVPVSSGSKTLKAPLPPRR